jgi:hypothetical protein
MGRTLETVICARRHLVREGSRSVPLKAEMNAAMYIDGDLATFNPALGRTSSIGVPPRVRSSHRRSVWMFLIFTVGVSASRIFRVLVV